MLGNNYNSKSGLPEDEERKAKIQKTIKDASKGSKYMEFQECKMKKIEAKVVELKKKLQTIQDRDPIQLTRASIESLRFIDQLEQKRDNSRTFVHFDLDAFFAAVEQLKDPSLVDVPMAVGGNAMLCTANYKARTFGVTSAMPGFIAKKLCPSLVIRPLDQEAYRKSSQEVMSILSSYDPLLHSYSMDEASLDFTSFGDVNIEKLVQEVRDKIKKETGISVSAGIAPTRPLAKMVSNRHKPDGQFYLPPSNVLGLLREEPIKNIHGIGQVTCHLLKGSLGVEKCKDILREVGPISLLFKQSNFLFASSIGIDIRHGSLDNDNDGNEGNDGDNDDNDSNIDLSRKSMSVERTVQPALTDILKIEKLLKALSDSLFHDLKKEKVNAKTLTLKMKSSDFQVVTRSVTFEHNCADVKEDLFTKFKGILNQTLIKDLRLLGVRASNLSPTLPEQRQQKQIDFFLKAKQEPSVNCPICSIALKDDASLINEHIDGCLK